MTRLQPTSPRPPLWSRSDRCPAAGTRLCGVILRVRAMMSLARWSSRLMSARISGHFLAVSGASTLISISAAPALLWIAPSGWLSSCAIDSDSSPSRRAGSCGPFRKSASAIRASAIRRRRRWASSVAISIACPTMSASVRAICHQYFLHSGRAAKRTSHPFGRRHSSSDQRCSARASAMHRLGTLDTARSGAAALASQRFTHELRRPTRPRSA